MRELKRFQSLEMGLMKRALRKREIRLWSQVDDASAKDVVEQLLYLEDSEPGKEITLLINSPGGSVTSGMAILDAMNLISSPISTVVMGMAASFGAVLLCSGARGRRFAYPHSQVMIHQPHISGQIVAPATDIRIHALQIIKSRDELNQIIASACGKSLEIVAQDTDRDFFMNAQEAMAYGLVDGIVEKL